MTHHITKERTHNYFFKVFKHGYFLISLLLACLSTTLVVCYYKFDFTSIILAVEGLKLYLISACSIFCLFVLIYLLSKIRCPRLSIADSIGFSLMISGIADMAVFLFMINEFDQTNITRIVIGGLIFILGLAYMFLRLAFFQRHEKHEIIYIKNSLTGYFTTVGQKYSFVSVMLSAMVLCAVTFIALDRNLANFITSYFYANTAYFVIFVVSAVVFLLYCIIEISSKSVNPVDVLLCSGIVVFPVTALNCFFLKETPSDSLTVLAIALTLYLVFVIVRVLSFDVTVLPKKANKRTLPEVILTIAVSVAIVGTACTIYPLLPFIEIGNIKSISVLPVCILIGAVVIPVLFSLVLSIVNIPKKTRNRADLFMDISLLTSVLSFLLLAVNFSLVLLAVLSAILLINLYSFTARLRILNS